MIYDDNREDHGVYYDNNGFLTRPAALGDEQPHTYQVTYLGLERRRAFRTLERLGLALLRVRHRQPRSARAAEGERRARCFAVAEVSRDFDWIRVRGTGLFQSGDKNPFDGKANGFDAIQENPQIAGADTSYWIRQAVPLIGGGGVALSGRNGVLASLRSSKDEGQSNFINPGLALVGIGADVDVTPRGARDRQPEPAVVRQHVVAVGAAQAGHDQHVDRHRPVGGRPVPAAASRRTSCSTRRPRCCFPGAGLKQLYAFDGDKTQYSILFNAAADLLTMAMTMRTPAATRLLRVACAHRRRCALRALVYRHAIAGDEGETPVRAHVRRARRRRPRSRRPTRRTPSRGAARRATRRATTRRCTSIRRVVLGCTDCHGGDATVAKPAGADAEGRRRTAPRCADAHVLPRYPLAWNYPSSANPEDSYTLLNREAPEFIRFVNPGDYRVARDACGACHLPIIQAAERSLMSTSAMLWGGASYNNGILPFKRYVLGEAYTPTRRGRDDRQSGAASTPFMTEKGILPQAVSAAGVGDDDPRPTSSACSSAAAA